MLTNRIAPLFVLGLMVATSIVGYFVLPSGNIPVPWFAKALHDHAPQKWLVLSLIPAISIVATLVMIYYPYYDPSSKNLDKQKGYRASVTITAIILLLFHVLNVSFAAGWTIEPLVAINVIAGLALILSGNYLTTVRQNFLFGVINPWTMDSEQVWSRTQRFAAKACIAGGSLLIIAAIAFEDRYWLLISLFLTLVAVAMASSLYSFLTWRSLQRS